MLMPNQKRRVTWYNLPFSSCKVLYGPILAPTFKNHFILVTYQMLNDNDAHEFVSMNRSTLGARLSTWSKVLLRHHFWKVWPVSNAQLSLCYSFRLSYSSLFFVLESKPFSREEEDDESDHSLDRACHVFQTVQIAFRFHFYMFTKIKVCIDI